MDDLDRKLIVTAKKLKVEMPPADVLSFYEISGQEPITPRAWKRYLDNKKDNDEKIKMSAGEGVQGREDFKLPIIRGPQIFHPIDYAHMSIADIWSMDLPLHEKTVWVRHKIRRAPQEEKASLLKTAKEILGNNLVEPVLYNQD